MGANVHAVDNKAMKPLNLASSKESNAATHAMLHAATIRSVYIHIARIYVHMCMRSNYQACIARHKCKSVYVNVCFDTFER
jgi:hypothetical protein